MKKTLRAAFLLAVLSTAMAPTFAQDPGGTIPPPQTKVSTVHTVIYTILALLGM